jgi:hypothetical protein
MNLANALAAICPNPNPTLVIFKDPALDIMRY